MVVVVSQVRKRMVTSQISAELISLASNTIINFFIGDLVRGSLL